ncbi:MAG: DUF11 domain-containing protein [Jiangellaceae bacterium]|nr:DUF11 domain-containing protein [Jiangellaceae bacterium]
MSMPGRVRMSSAVLAAGAVFATGPAAAVEVRPLEPRFGERVTGDISIASGYARATAARPAGSTLLFAGLYWGGWLPANSAAASRATVRVGSAAPATVTADQLDTHPTGGFGAVADVTALFEDAGPFVDVIVDDPGSEPWTLVTAWSSPGEPLRDLRIVDGLANASDGLPATVVVDGLSTPGRGPIQASVNVVAYGDDARGSAQVAPGQSIARVPVTAEDGETLIAAVTTSTEASAVTDLALTAQVNPRTARPGDTVEFAVTIRNRGPDDQTGPATLTVRPPDGLEPDALSLYVSNGACGLSRAGAVCAVDPLGAGDDAELRFTSTVDADTSGSLTTLARVLAPTADTDPVAANDAATADLRVDRSSRDASTTTPRENMPTPPAEPASTDQGTTGGGPPKPGESAQAAETPTADRTRPAERRGVAKPITNPGGSADHQQR